MSELTWKVVRPLLDRAPIKKLEEVVGVAIPEDFIECVVRNNAGYPSHERFETAEGIEHICNNLLSFDEKKNVNIYNTYDSIIALTGNKLLLPFAEDPFGNYICFDFSGSDVKVVFWEHETKKIEVVSSTFNEFLAKLSPSE